MDTLQVTGITKNYGALRVLKGVDFAMSMDEAVGVVGPNGAGKTTFLSVLVGATPASAGDITFRDKDITHTKSVERCNMGIVRTHQIPKPFGGLTVFENVLVAASFGGGKQGVDAYEAAVQAIELSDLLHIANRSADSVGLLDRKRLELARALATDPALLLLDEIGGGLTDAECQQLIATINELHGRQIGIVWIEHVVHVLLQVVGRLICIDAGAVIADGDPQSVMSDPNVISAYLGGGVK